MDLSAYARAMRCPLLTQCMVWWYQSRWPCFCSPGTISASIGLRACYAMSGTDVAGASVLVQLRCTDTSLRVLYALAMRSSELTCTSSLAACTIIELYNSVPTSPRALCHLPY
eukprot:2789766-Rhodomonas_salina.7